jgi:vacuolar protein sorting-associated protein 35
MRTQNWTTFTKKLFFIMYVTPPTNYSIDMTTFDELIFVENHFLEERKSGRKMADLYESVQHAAHIIPRLYLMITVGSAYIKTKEAKASYVLKDLLDMVKGVQQPVRGLFLRFYLLKTMKDLLPDKGMHVILNISLIIFV